MTKQLFKLDLQRRHRIHSQDGEYEFLKSKDSSLALYHLNQGFHENRQHVENPPMGRVTERVFNKYIHVYEIMEREIRSGFGDDSFSWSQISEGN